MTNILPDSSTNKAKHCRYDTSTQNDIYKNYIAIEENEASTRSPENDSQLFLESCANIKNILKDIHDLKTKKTKNHLSDQVHKKVIQATSNVVTLKTLNRLEKIRTVSSRKTCFAERDKADAVNSQYQNLLYEHAHVKSEYNKFISSVLQDKTDQLLNEVPFNLATLELEVTQQKQSDEQCKKLQDEKRTLEAEILELRSNLDELTPKLNAVWESTKPLQEYFGLQGAETLSNNNLALLLPNPLYLFFKNIDSYSRVYDDINIQLEICGNANEAKGWRKSLQINNVEIEKQETLEDQRRKLLEVHPLSVSCSISSKNGPKLKMVFYYCTKLNIVTVVSNIQSFEETGHNLVGKEILADEKILDELFPSDFGAQSPNPDNEYQFEKLGICTFRNLTKQIGFPYNWAQKVCGMEFLPFENTESRTRSSCTSIATVMKAIVRRLGSRTCLAAQLQELEENLLSKTPSTISIPRTVISLLFEWSPVTWENYCQRSSTADLRLNGIVGFNDFFYSAVIKRNNSANLHAFVAVKSDYPIQSPIFSLTVKFNGELFHSGNCDGVRDMERAVNVMTDPSNPRWLLSSQLHHLCAYFDIFLETTFSSSFAQKMVFFKNVRGRNRRRPFNFENVGIGFFSHYKPLGL